MAIHALLLVQALVGLTRASGSEVTAVASDTNPPVIRPTQAWSNAVQAASSSPLVTMPKETLPDTTKPFEYSNGYGVRLDIHKTLGYLTLPLMIGQYLTGNEILHKGSDAPNWAKDLHGPMAIGLGTVFVTNTVTGVWNMIEAKPDPVGRSRRNVHGGIMLLAEAGIAYSAVIAPSMQDIDDRIAAGERGGWTDHKKVALASMAFATVGYLMMYLID